MKPSSTSLDYAEDLAERFPHARKLTVTVASVSDENGEVVDEGGEITVAEAVRVFDRCRDAERLRVARAPRSIPVVTVGRPGARQRPRERRERRSYSRSGDSGDDSDPEPPGRPVPARFDLGPPPRIHPWQRQLWPEPRL